MYPTVLLCLLFALPPIKIFSFVSSAFRFHGRCVGITQAAAKQYKNPNKKWYCAKCREDQQNDHKLLPDKRPAPKPVAPQSKSLSLAQ